MLMDNVETSPMASGETKQEISSTNVVEERVDASNKTDNIAVSSPVEKNKKHKTLVIIIVIFVLLACGATAFFLLKDKIFPEQNNPIVKDNKEQSSSELRMGGNSLSDFDIAFLKNDGSEANKVYSPLSIKYALRMLSDGAKGETKDEIDRLVGDYKAKAYTNSKNRSFANALFVQTDQKNNILDSYMNGLKTNYAASVIYDDFTSSSAINKWVSDETLGIVDDMFSDSEVSEQDFLLVNALAIDMNWNTHIQCAITDPANPDVESKSYGVGFLHEKYSAYIPCVGSEAGFETIDFNSGKKKAKTAQIGATINKYDIVKALGEDKIRSTVKPEYEKWLKSEESRDENGNYYDYVETDVEKYLTSFINELKENYGKVEDSTDFEMYNDDNAKVFVKDLKEYDGSVMQYVGIMPKKQNLKDYVASTDAGKLSKLIDKAYEIKAENFKDGVITKVVGNIPFFKYDYDIDLKEALQELGIKKVFNANEADLSNMTKVEKTSITDAKHKADIEFSNSGIRAAAATGMSGDGGGGSFEYQFDVPVETIDMTFDKPFMYLIRDKKSGEIWFTGAVYEPES